VQVLYLKYHLIIVTICAKLFQNPLNYEEVLDRLNIYPITDYVNIWPLSVTLILEVGMQVLRMTHRHIIVNNCGKYLQNPFKDKKSYRPDTTYTLK
jgi:hypothetical protein